jgi:hypothetical protein
MREPDQTERTGKAFDTKGAKGAKSYTGVPMTAQNDGFLTGCIREGSGD